MVACDLVSCDLVSCDLVSCDLASCDLVSCDLASCDLASCDLASCDLVACDLVHVWPNMIVVAHTCSLVEVVIVTGKAQGVYNHSKNGQFTLWKIQMLQWVLPGYFHRWSWLVVNQSCIVSSSTLGRILFTYFFHNYSHIYCLHFSFTTIVTSGHHEGCYTEIPYCSCKWPSSVRSCMCVFSLGCKLRKHAWWVCTTKPHDDIWLTKTSQLSRIARAFHHIWCCLSTASVDMWYRSPW